MSTIVSFIKKKIHLTILGKLLISYILFLLIPLIFYTLITYSFAKKELEKQLMFSADQNYEHSYREISASIENAQDMLLNSFYNDNLLSFLSKNQFEINQYSERYGEYLVIQDWLKGIKDFQHQIRLRIYLSPYYDYLCNNITTFNIKSFYNETNQKDISQIYSPVWYNNNDEYISVAKSAYDPDNTSRFTGIVEADIPISNLLKYMNNGLFEKENTIIIRHNDGTILSTGKNIDYNTITNLADKDSKYANWKISTYNDEKTYVRKQSFLNNQWTFYYFIPTTSIIKSSDILRNYFFIAYLLFIPIGFLTAKAISHSQIYRIYGLIKSINPDDGGRPKYYTGHIGTGEYADLINTYNKMIAQIDSLTDQCFKSGKELKNSELRLLQAQINPHFLYNTLDNINVVALRRNVPEISKMIKEMVSFYKLGLNQGKDIVPLFDEIAQVKAYVNIMNLRFENSIELKIDIPSSVLSCKIPKLSLQPIVENSVCHGIFEKDSHSGTIVISADTIDDLIIIKVSDDGVGISKKTLSFLNSHEQTEGKNHFGVSNVNNRLKLLFGEKYGMEFANRLEGGALVTIKIPVEYQDAD